MKKCSCCHELKNENLFRLGHSKCRNCYSKISSAWNKNHKEITRLSSKKYSKTHKINYKSKYGIGITTIRNFGLNLALFVYDRAQRRCEQCCEENDLTIHHIDGNGRHNKEKGLPMNNDPKNLIVLCRRCHGSIHGKQSKGIKKPRK